MPRSVVPVLCLEHYRIQLSQRHCSVHCWWPQFSCLCNATLEPGSLLCCTYSGVLRILSRGYLELSVLMLSVNRRAAHSIAVIVQRCSNPNRLPMSYVEKRKRRNKPINQNVKQREKKHPWESVLPRFQWQHAREGWQLLSVLPVGLTSATCTLFSIPCKQSA